MRSSPGSTTSASPPVPAPLTTVAVMLSSFAGRATSPPLSGVASSRTVKTAPVAANETELPESSGAAGRGIGGCAGADCVTRRESNRDRSQSRAGLVAAAAAVARTIAAAAADHAGYRRADPRGRLCFRPSATRARNADSSTIGIETDDKSSRISDEYSLNRLRRSRHTSHCARCRSSAPALNRRSPSMSATMSPSLRWRAESGCVTMTRG